jgi:hypothetical protein
MRQVNQVVLSAVDTASQNGVQIDSNQLINASFQAVFGDSSAAGTFLIQASNDVAPLNYSGSSSAQFVATNWTNIPNATATITAGGSAIISLSEMSYRWLRAVYTHSSGGSSTVKVSMFGMGI